MATTLVHIGDFHAGPGARNADRYRALDQIGHFIETAPQIGAVLWPGDLNHGRMTIEDRNRLAETILDYARIAPVVICYGNHDLPGDLDVFRLLRGYHPIYVIDRPQTLRLKLATGAWASIFVLPYPTKAGLVAQGVADGDLVATAADALDAIFMQAAAELAAARANGDLTLMIGHVNVAGSLTSTGQPNIGREIEIGPQQLDRLGPIYKGLNHIHQHQAIAGAVYPGSVCRLSWGEIEDKGFVTVHYRNDADDPAWAWQPLDVAPMYHVEGLLTREAFTYQVTAGPGGDVQPTPESWRGCEVRVRVRFKQSEKQTLAMAQVHAEFAEAARLEVEPIAVPDRELRAPAVAIARTLADKLAAYAGQPLTPAQLDKLAALEHGDALQIVRDVHARLAALEGDEPEETEAVA